MLEGTRPCTKVSRKRVPSPLTSRARTYAPTCLTHSPRSIKGRQSEHRDPVARQSPGSQRREGLLLRCRACSARDMFGAGGNKGRACRKRRPVTVGRPGEGGSRVWVPRVGPYGTSIHAE